MSEFSELTFEQALKELEGLIHQLEDGRTTLEQAVCAYEKGVLLKEHCEKKLRQARTRVEKITVNSTGDVQTEPVSFRSAACE